MFIYVFHLRKGSGGGALLSQANLDRGIVKMFSGSEDELSYGESGERS